ncbi:MAG TPA: hypothetical protein VK456_01325 [Xanthobacteraceae bacterium]|nr:hypothetical protein [Xanthobacteraceae bacterium]
MAKLSQTRRVANHRRHRGPGISRYQVCGLNRDKELIRQVARQLAADDAAAKRLRKELTQKTVATTPSGASIVAALRRSPLVGVDWEIERPIEHGREIDL